MSVERRRYERRVVLSDTEVQVSRLALEDMLRTKGINPAKPYQQRDIPSMRAHGYVQRGAEEDALHGRH